jgi:hypothetical protein
LLATLADSKSSHFNLSIPNVVVVESLVELSESRLALEAVELRVNLVVDASTLRELVPVRVSVEVVS